MAAPAGRKITTRLENSGLAREDLIRAFRMIQMSRRIDDREILLKRQQKIYFQISGAGHEAPRSLDRRGPVQRQAHRSSNRDGVG